MRVKLSIAVLLAITLALCFVATQVIAEKGECNKNETKVTIDQVPQAVAATLQQAAGNGTIDEIEQKNKGGVFTYSADITKDGLKWEAKVAADGKLIKMKEEKADEEGDEKGEGKCEENDEANEANEVAVNFADLPAVVQSTIKQFAGAGTIDEVEKETKDGVVVFSADVTKDGQTLDVYVAADGKLIKSEIDEPSAKTDGDEATEQDEDGEVD